MLNSDRLAMLLVVCVFLNGVTTTTTGELEEANYLLTRVPRWGTIYRDISIREAPNAGAVALSDNKHEKNYFPWGGKKRTPYGKIGENDGPMDEERESSLNFPNAAPAMPVYYKVYGLKDAKVRRTRQSKEEGVKTTWNGQQESLFHTIDDNCKRWCSDHFTYDQ